MMQKINKEFWEESGMDMEFIVLNDGDEVRLQFTNYITTYRQHWVNGVGLVCNGGPCALCDLKYPLSNRYIAVVISDAMPRLFSFGYAIKKQLAHINKKYGDPTKKMLLITRLSRVNYKVESNILHDANPYVYTEIVQAYLKKIDLNKILLPATKEQVDTALTFLQNANPPPNPLLDVKSIPFYPSCLGDLLGNHS